MRTGKHRPHPVLFFPHNIRRTGTVAAVRASRCVACCGTVAMQQRNCYDEADFT
jgi:hypothetical protein